MKKYVSCFLFFLCLTVACLITLFLVTGRMEMESEQVQMTESIEQPALAESEDLEESPAYHMVLNLEKVTPVPQEDEETKAEEKYCLVAEEGYLIVYSEDKGTVDMFTHMPLSDFPADEQEKLMEGIWFPTMVEIFNYLESYTS